MHMNTFNITQYLWTAIHLQKSIEFCMLAARIKVSAGGAGGGGHGGGGDDGRGVKRKKINALTMHAKQYHDLAQQAHKIMKTSRTHEVQKQEAGIY